MIKVAEKVYVIKGKYKLDVVEKAGANPAKCGVEQVVEAKATALVVVERLIKRLAKVGINATSEIPTVRSGFGSTYVSIIVVCDSVEYGTINDIAALVSAQE